MSADKLLTVLFNAGVAVSIIATVLSLGMSFTGLRRPVHPAVPCEIVADATGVQIKVLADKIEAAVWPRSGSPQAGAAGFGAAARACLRLARRYLTPSMARKAVTTAIRMGAVCSAPTWVRNAAISTIENGAGASAPGTAASRQVNASPSGTLGMTWWTMTPAVPPMNSDGKMGPPTSRCRRMRPSHGWESRSKG